MVFNTWRNFGIHQPVDQPIFFKFPQGLRQHFLTDAADLLLKLGKAHRVFAQFIDDHERPFVGDAAKQFTNQVI